jgi:hypothetical protein
VKASERWIRAVRRTELKPRAKHVAEVLASKYMDWDTLGSCYPGRSKLATETSMSVRTVDAALADLVAAGWLIMVKRGRTGRNTLYRGAWGHAPQETRDEPGDVRVYTREYGELSIAELYERDRDVVSWLAYEVLEPSPRTLAAKAFLEERRSA